MADSVSYRPVQTGQGAPMLRLETIVGLATAPEFAEALHHLDHHGQVEYLTLSETDRAVVVRMQALQWLTLQPRDAAAALELGYFAGNMHWKVEFDGVRLRIALQGPLETYLERLGHLLSDGRAARVND
jgi:urease accessory protein